MTIALSYVRLSAAGLIYTSNRLCRNRHEQSVRTQTMKIIKPCNFRRIPRLRASPRHGGAVRCFANIPADTDPPRGRPRGASITSKTPPRPLRRRVADTRRASAIFYGWVKIIPVHAGFSRAPPVTVLNNPVLRLYRQGFFL